MQEIQILQLQKVKLNSFITAIYKRKKFCNYAKIYHVKVMI